MLSLGKLKLRPRPWWLIVLAFCVSRIYAYAAGLRFDGSEWQRFWHFVDPELLESSLLESIYYLHSQPPLPNLFMGISLKLFGSALPAVFSFYFLCLGALLSAGTYLLMRRMRVSTWTASILCAIWCASPAMLLFENFLFYTYPVLAMLVASAYCLERYFVCQSRRPLVIYFALVTGIVLTRTLFHPLWLVCALSLPFLFANTREHRRTTWALAMVSCALVGSVMVKNRLEFGTASLSSWRGMNIARTVLDRLPRETRAKWVRDGKLSAWANIGSFRALNQYAGLKRTPLSGVALLDQVRKSNKAINLHNRAYIAVSEQLQRDALWVIRTHPQLYLYSFGQSLLDSAQPAHSYRALRKPLAHISGIESLYDIFLSWKLGKRKVGPWLLAFPLLVVFGFFCIGRASDKKERALWIFTLGSILWVVLIGALAERSENARFRFLVDPFLLLFAGRMISDFSTFARKKSPEQQSRRSRNQTH